MPSAQYVLDALTHTVLARLESLLATLRNHHNALRVQNDRVVKVGLSMEATLQPIEDGLRLENERMAADEANARTGFGGGAEEVGGGDPVDTVNPQT